MDYSARTDEDLGALQASYADAERRRQQAEVEFRQVPEQYKNTAAAARLQESLLAAEQAARAAQAQLAEAQFYRDVAAHAEQYKSLPGRIESDLRAWRPPAHPRPEEAFAAEESPQLANSWGEWRPFNKPLVKTGRMWERDNRAAELARRLQQERRLAEQAGPARLAAFDSTFPLATKLETDVSATYQPGFEEWGLLNKALSLPSAFASVFSGTAERLSGAALAAAGVPNKSWDDRNALSWQTSNAADDLMGNIPTGLYYMATGDKQLAPGYARAYWDDVKRRESEPLFTLRPQAQITRPQNFSYDTGYRAYEYADDMTKGMPEPARMGIGLGAMLVAGTATDPFMPNYAAASRLGRVGLAAKDLGYGSALQGALLAPQFMPMDYRDQMSQAAEAAHSQSLAPLIAR